MSNLYGVLSIGQAMVFCHVSELAHNINTLRFSLFVCVCYAHDITTFQVEIFLVLTLQSHWLILRIYMGKKLVKKLVYHVFKHVIALESVCLALIV